MNFIVKPRALALAAGVCCMMVAYAVAQQGQVVQPGQPGRPDQPGRIDLPGQPTQPQTGTQQRSQYGQTQQQAGTRGVSQDVEHYLLSCMLEKNQAEVEIAQFAQQRAQHPEVKQFAERLIQDHQQTIQKIQRATGSQANIGGNQGVRQTSFEAQADSSQPATAGRTQAGRTERTMSGTTGGGSQNAALEQLVSIEKQIVEKGQQNLREKLQSKQGAEFDHCFLGAQIAAHMHMIAALEVLQNQPGELGQLARDSQPKVKQHLDEAEKLAEQLMNSSDRQAGAQSPTRVPR